MPKLFGNSSQELPIFSYQFGNRGPVILILGGVHGDESEGVWIAMRLLEKWIKHFPYKLRLTLVPCFNIEGSLQHTRTNFNKVDLNRNLPTKNWTSHFPNAKYHPGSGPCSEPENKALVKWISTNKPKLIISLHSWNPLINTNGNCQPEAGIIAKATGYKTVDYIGYSTPGSLGDYCEEKERNIPLITYEANKGANIKDTLKLHIPAIEQALFASEKRTD